MTTTADINANDKPVFDVQLQAISEAVDGNGVVDAGDLALSSGSNAMDVDVATGTARFDGTTSTLSSGDTVTLDTGDPNDDRWDTIVYDVAAGAVQLHKGTPAAAPTPPDLEADEVLLGLVSVDATQTSLSSDDILNWRFPTAYPLGVGDLDTPYDPLTQLGTTLGASLDASALSGSMGTFTPAVKYDGLDETGLFAEANLAANPGANQSSIGTGFVVSDSGGANLLQFAMFVDTDGSGNLTNQRVSILAPTTNIFTSNLSLNGGTTIDDGGTTIWDGSEIPMGVLGGPASSLTSYPLPVGDIVDNPSWDTAPTYQQWQVWQEQTTPSGSPSAGEYRIYLKSDGTLYVQDDAGNETQAGGTNQQRIFEGRESGTVTAGNQGLLTVDSLADGDAVEIYKAALTLATGEPAPADLDLLLVTLDNAGSYTSRATLVSGDGSTVHDDETGDPLGSWTNGTGSEQTIGVLVDNATGSNQEVMALSEGVTEA